MARHILASNGDMEALLFGKPDIFDGGAVKWEEDSPPPFVRCLRERAKSYGDLLYILCQALHGKDEEIAAHAKKDVTEAIKNGWNVHPTVVAAIRSCNLAVFRQGFDAGVVLAMGRYLRDFSLEYTCSDGEDRADLYCFKEKGGPSTFSIHLGKEVWLNHKMEISLPTVPASLQMALIGKPIRSVVDHPGIDAEDVVEGISNGKDFMEITGLRNRTLQDYEFSPMRAKD